VEDTLLLIHRHLQEESEPEFLPEKDREDIGNRISDMVNCWAILDNDFPKENLNNKAQLAVIQEYIWIQHVMLELEAITRVFEVDGSKTTLNIVQDWLMEIHEALNPDQS
jgi:hypothetical protein